MIDTASVGGPVAIEEGNAAPILNVGAPPLGPTLNTSAVPGLPKELQPEPGDVLLSRAFWPWADLGAQGIPEHWLYMSRHVQGVIAQLSVQTPNGPQLAKANTDGSLQVATRSTPAGQRTFMFQFTLAANTNQDIITPNPALSLRLYFIRGIVLSAPQPQQTLIRASQSGTGICWLSNNINTPQDWPIEEVTLLRGESVNVFNFDPVNPVTIFLTGLHALFPPA